MTNFKMSKLGPIFILEANSFNIVLGIDTGLLVQTIHNQNT